MAPQFLSALEVNLTAASIDSIVQAVGEMIDERYKMATFPAALIQSTSCGLGSAVFTAEVSSAHTAPLEPDCEPEHAIVLSCMATSAR